jgi:hypothetical protein
VASGEAGERLLPPPTRPDGSGDAGEIVEEEDPVTKEAIADERAAEIAFGVSMDEGMPFRDEEAEEEVETAAAAALAAAVANDATIAEFDIELGLKPGSELRVDRSALLVVALAGWMVFNIESRFINGVFPEPAGTPATELTAPEALRTFALNAAAVSEREAPKFEEVDDVGASSETFDELFEMVALEVRASGAPLSATGCFLF